MEQQRNYTVKQFRPNENCWQSDTAHSYYAAAPVGSPPPQPTGGLATFPDNAPKIFVLPQNTLTLAFNATKSQPHSPRTWRRLRRIFAMLAKERKDALREFLRLSDKIGKEVVIQPKVQRLREDLAEKEKKRRKLTEKPLPDLSCIAWLFGVVPALCRAPDNAALRCVGGCVFFHAA
jgi:hypothetical protein